MWNPDPIVTIGGVDYTDQVLNGVQLTFGAPDFLAGVQPPYGTVTIINTTGSALPIYLSSDIQVTVSNSAGTGRIALFSGVISDMSVSLAATDLAFYDLTVIGYSQFFESRIINEVPINWGNDVLGFSTTLQYDYERFEYLVKAGTGAPIDLLSGTIDAQTGTIAALPNYLGSYYQSPVSYDRVEQLPEGAATAGQLIAEFANGVSGWVWEDRFGEINYRAFDNLSTTSHTIPQGSVYVNQLRKFSTLTELYNDVTIYDIYDYVYKYTDTASQASYGVRQLSLVSQYTSSSRYPEQGAYLLEYLANNINQLTGLVTDLTVDDYLAAARDALLQVDMTQTINFTVPDDVFDTGTGSGRVCGWSWEIANKTLNLSLNLVKVE